MWGMMDGQRLRELLDERFIEPTRMPRRLYAGVELEFPLVNLTGAPVDFLVAHLLTERFCEHFSFEPVALDNHGNVYAVACPTTGDSLTYDCSYNNLELSFGRVEDLCEVARRLGRYYAFIQEQLAAAGHTLTGMGINPHRALNRHEPLPNGRYRMLYRFLCSAALQPQPNHFHAHYDFGMFTSASQVQIDVTCEALIPTLRAHDLLEPLKAALFANSLLEDRGVRYLCARDMLWADSMHGFNPRNTGAFEKLPRSVGELLDYLAAESIFCTERDGHYLTFTPVPIAEFLACETTGGEFFEDGQWHRVTFIPDERDVAYLRTYKFNDLTFRGTIEYRSCCCQPVRDALSVAAFHLGLAGAAASERLLRLLGEDNPLLADSTSTSAPASDTTPAASTPVPTPAPTPAMLRRQLVRQDWPPSLDRTTLRHLLLEVLERARDGLVARGRGEERFLAPLYERAERLENPAQRMLRLQREGWSPERIIRDYASPAE
jgi:gamma-glutamylcysteine synthetase